MFQELGIETAWDLLEGTFQMSDIAAAERHTALLLADANI